MASLQLNVVKARENSGAITTARYRFQANLAILQMLELQQASGDDYFVLLEHFDDITVYRPHLGKPLTFIQAKGKNSGSWTINSLTKCSDSETAPSSIIGKLYQNASNFPGATDALIFVSNAPFSVKLNDGTPASKEPGTVRAVDFHPDEQTKISATLDPDFPSPRVPKCKAVLKLRRVSLDASDPDNYVIGALAKWTEETSISGIACTAVYKTLFSEVIAKSSRVSTAENEDDLLKSKAISRKQFEELIGAASNKKRFKDFEAIISQDLVDAGHPSKERIQILASCNKFLANRSLGRPFENLLTEEITKAAAGSPATIADGSSILQIAKDLIEISNLPADADYRVVLGAALVVACENLDD